MRRIILCLTLCVVAGCSGSSPAPVSTAPTSVSTQALKDLLNSVAQSGTAGSGLLQVRIGVEASGKEELKKDLEELTKADGAGQTEQVKQIATKMAGSL